MKIVDILYILVNLRCFLRRQQKVWNRCYRVLNTYEFNREMLFILVLAFTTAFPSEHNSRKRAQHNSRNKINKKI